MSTTDLTVPKSTGPRPAPPRRGLVAIAVVFVLVVTMVGVVQLLSQVVRGSSTKDSVLTSAVPRLTVATSAGDVTLVPSTDGAVHVHTQTRYGLTAPELVAESTPAGIRLAATCHGFFASGCEVSYTVALPANFAVAVDTGSGDVTARDLTGRLDADLSSGDVDLYGLSGDIGVRTSSGNVTGTGLRSAVVHGEASSGDLTVSLVAPPREVVLRTSSGDVDVAVPASRAYRVDTDTDSGAQHVSVPTDPATDATVQAETSSGDVTVRPT